MVTVTLPALVGMGDTNLGLLQTGITRQKRQHPYAITFPDGQTLLTGPYVDLYARPSQRLDTERLGDSLEQRALTLTTLALLARQLLPADQLNQPLLLGLIVALPVHVLQGPEARQVVQALEGWLLGAHTFQLDGQPFTLEVGALRTMAQPLGAFFEWGLDPRGQWQRSPSDLKASTAVLDQGYNTTDLFHLSGGQIIRRYTAGQTSGMRRAASMLQELVAQKTGRQISLAEADSCIRQASRRGKASLLVQGQPLDLKPLANQVLDMAAGEVRAYLSQVWENGAHFDYILLTGGGILALGDRIRRVFPLALELPDPVTANARGLARFAQRAGVLEHPNQVAQNPAEASR